MAAVTFTQVGTLALYASSASADAGVAGYWAGYRPAPGSSPGATVTLQQSWDDIGGSYLFLAATPSDFTAFSAALDAWLAAQGAMAPRFLWIANPDDPPFYWKTTAWFATGTTSGSATRWALHGVAGFGLGIYRLDIAAGTELTLDTSEPAGATIADAGATFRSGAGSFGPTGTSAIGFQGAGIGAWTGTLSVAADGLADLGVGLHYAVRYALNPADPRLVPVDMPVLGAASAAISLSAAWDPMFPMERARTRFVFSGTAPAIDATFVTQRGYATTLTPADAAAPLWPGGLMFARAATRIDATSDGGTDLYNITPDGVFSLAVVAPSGGAGSGLTDQLMLGLSGLESAALGTSGTSILFEAGKPAFAPTAIPGGTVPSEGAALLTGLATTAWVAVLPPTSGQSGLSYYAQSRQSPLFQGTGTATLSYIEVPIARLSTWQTGGAVPETYPVGAYAGVSEAQAAAARALEQAALAPARRQLITGSPPGLEDVADDADVIAVTPQGLTVTLPSDLSSIDRVVIANLPDAPEPQLAFTDIGSDFEAALFTNQLFFVVSNVTTFLAQAACVPPFLLDLDGWVFRLNPDHWRTGDAPTIMVWKYADRSLEALAADASSWAWQAAAEDEAGSVVPTWRTLNAILAQARAAEEDDATSPYARFYRDVVADPGWNGVLFLNAPVDLADLPPSLRFVAAGLDPERFYAHHVGASVTPFDPTTTPITLKKTSVFGLINYTDTVDLVPSETLPFEFKTMQLTARFANAHLAEFSTQVEISMNRLFAAALAKQDTLNGNNLMISGALQKSGGAPAYAFTLLAQNRYAALFSALTNVEITSVRIETLANPTPTRVATNFILGGKLRFFAPDGFDLFGYGLAPGETQDDPPFDGYLVFNQLALTMDFDISDPQTQVWTVNETGIGFDLPNSVARPDSLVACFPVTVRSLVASPDLAPVDEEPRGVAPEEMGYLSISAPLDQVPMISPWYGLVLSIDLGSLGALAGSAGIKAEILAAWMPGARDGDLPVYLGLKIPGTEPRSGSFPLQGVLKLGFKSFIFSTYEQNGQRAYLLTLSRFALSVLGFSFPPGNLDLSLFGGPEGRSTGQLGWLGAYVDPDARKEKETRRRIAGPEAATGMAAPAPPALPAPAPSPRKVRRKRLGRLGGRGEP